MEKSKQSLFRTIFGMMISPSKYLKDALVSTKWYITVLISGLAFALFFTQTGLDLFKTGQKPLSFIFVSLIVGFLYGTLMIPFLGAISYSFLKLGKTDKTIGEIISCFCLSYCGALIYCVLGFLFSMILGWKTSVSFGVTGVLWAIGPMMVSIRDMLSGKTTISILLSTTVSAVVLISWSFFGSI